MRHTLICFGQWIVAAAVVCCGLSVRGEEVRPQPLDGKIKWIHSYAEGKQAARRNGKPLFVVFRCER